jgi:NADH:ubiquinone oxidoreductase subunit 4 (subunit M)
MAVLVPMAFAVIVLGIIPGKLLKTFEAPVTQLLQTRSESSPQREPATVTVAVEKK